MKNKPSLTDIALNLGPSKLSNVERAILRSKLSPAFLSNLVAIFAIRRGARVVIRNLLAKHEIARAHKFDKALFYPISRSEWKDSADEVAGKLYTLLDRFPRVKALQIRDIGEFKSGPAFRTKELTTEAQELLYNAAAGYDLAGKAEGLYNLADVLLQSDYFWEGKMILEMAQTVR